MLEREREVRGARETRRLVAHVVQRQRKRARGHEGPGRVPERAGRDVSLRVRIGRARRSALRFRESDHLG